MSHVPLADQQTAIGTEFVAALASYDYDRLRSCFHPEVRFRALIPSGLREGSNPVEAAAWLQRWFGDTEELYLLASSVDRIADRLHIAYRIRVREGGEWELVEQHAYCVLEQDLIVVMSLLCSGFRPENDIQAIGDFCDMSSSPNRTGPTADAYYDAGARGCAEGPIDEIARLMRGLEPGQMLEVHATDPSVIRDLPAWCRMVGHDLVRSEADRYLIRHK